MAQDPQYDAALTRDYQAAKANPSPFQILSYGAFLRVIGKTDRMRIADFGCGSGVSTRLLTTIGTPRKLVGYDISADMLGYARETEKASPLGIEYVQADCGSDGDNGIAPNFDLVTGMWLLHYADSLDALRNFAYQIRDALHHGGRTVMMVQDKVRRRQASKKYGEWRSALPRNPPEGSKQTVFLLAPDESEICRIQIHFWTRETYSRIFAEAGFKDIVWTDLQFSAEERVANPSWREIESAASCSLFTATKG